MAAYGIALNWLERRSLGDSRPSGLASRRSRPGMATPGGERSGGFWRSAGYCSHRATRYPPPMLALIVTLAATAAIPNAVADISYTSTQEAAKRVASCGFASRDVRVEADRDLQEDVIKIHVAGSPSNAAYRCVSAVSLQTVHYVYFDGGRQADYELIYREAEKQHDAMIARRWLSAHGLLKKMPRLDHHSDVAAYGAKLETACGITPHAALVASGNLLTFKSDRSSGPEVSDYVLTCLTYGAAIAGAPLGFLGNAAESASDQSR